jgi:hypothetical protein
LAKIKGLGDGSHVPGGTPAKGFSGSLTWWRHLQYGLSKSPARRGFLIGNVSSLFSARSIVNDL